MCLTELDSKNKFPRPQIGYKLFDYIKGNELNLSPIQTCYSPEKIETAYLNKWLRDSNKENLRVAGHASYYQSGYHFFTSINDARNWRNNFGWHSCGIVKIKFRKVVATGSQYKIKVVVAREICPIEIVKLIKE
jgi:hypothetical protein